MGGGKSHVTNESNERWTWYSDGGKFIGQKGYDGRICLWVTIKAMMGLERSGDLRKEMRGCTKSSIQNLRLLPKIL